MLPEELSKRRLLAQAGVDRAVIIRERWNRQ